MRTDFDENSNELFVQSPEQHMSQAPPDVQLLTSSSNAAASQPQQLKLTAGKEENKSQGDVAVAG